ncbi:Rof/RNase P-like protein [Sporodiniella umbellata]|nr:Rof/RNase P-like protein [Sporodiniella umbellata]
MNKGESLYQKLSADAHGQQGSEGVKGLLKEFVSPNTDVDQLNQGLRPVYLDRAHTFVKETEKKKMARLLKRKKDRKLTAKEKRKLKVYDIPKNAQRYELFEPLSELWQGYMQSLLDKGEANFEQKLIKADFHGAPFTVVQSTNPSYVGVSGIMVQETLSMFKIITRTNQLKQIPKNTSIFDLYVQPLNKSLTIYGQQFVSRPSDRAAKKFKPKPSIDL